MEENQLKIFSEFLKHPTLGFDSILKQIELLKDNKYVNQAQLSSHLNECREFYSGFKQKFLPLLESNDFVIQVFLQQVNDKEKITQVQNYLNQFTVKSNEERQERFVEYPPVKKYKQSLNGFDRTLESNLNNFDFTIKGIGFISATVIFVFGVVVDLALNKLMKLINLEEHIRGYLSKDVIEYINVGITVLIVQKFANPIEELLKTSLEKRKFKFKLNELKKLSRKFNNDFDSALENLGYSRDTFADAAYNYLRDF